jgi:hypothetical protein
MKLKFLLILIILLFLILFCFADVFYILEGEAFTAYILIECALLFFIYKITKKLSHENKQSQKSMHNF